MQNNLHDVSADKPISTPPEDRLGYDGFARHLAQSIRTIPAPEGFVIAVHGHWGSGKTSLINLIEYHLQQDHGKDETPVIVGVNPWWFSTHEDLARLLFSHLLGKLSGRSQEVNQLRTKLANFAEVVSEAPIPYAKGAGVVSKVARPRMKDIPALKSEIGDLLRKRGTRYLVVIDDIDRLTPSEVVELFRVVKAVGDLPNVIYLLAFDREIAAQALVNTYGERAADYLEKIVQLPLELPLIEKRSLRAIFFKKLDLIIGAPPEGLFETSYWASVFFDGIDAILNTPRDIVRLTNALTVNYGAMRGEVNAVDFIAVESLRLFCPPVYAAIKSNQPAFTLSQHGIPTSAFKELYGSTIKGAGTYEEAIKRLLVRLFPHLDQVWKSIQSHRVDDSVLRRQLRICVPEHFPRYFRSTPPEGTLSQTRMKAILEHADNSQAFGAELVELVNEIGPDGTSLARQFLEWLQDYTRDEIEIAEIPPILSALFNVGDRLLREEDRMQSLFDSGNEVRISRVIYQLGQRLEPSKRFNVFMEAVQLGSALATTTSQIVSWGQEHGKYRSEDDHPETQRTTTVTADQLKQLEDSICVKIERAAEDGSLIGHNFMPQILYLWKRLAGDGAVQGWVAQLFSHSEIEELIPFIAAFANTEYIQTMDDPVVRRQLRLDPESLEPFVNVSSVMPAIVERLRRWIALEEEGKVQIDLRHSAAIQQFLVEWDMRQTGKDPNARGAFDGRDQQS